MKYSEKNLPLVCMQTNSTCYKGTRKMTVKGVLWHSTGANNPTIKRYVQPSDNAADRAQMLAIIGTNANKNDWNHIYHEAGLNCWIGKLADGSVATVQTMPWDYRPWGCGSGSKGSCNDGWIQFEICEDGLTDRSYFEQVYKEACEITAYLCKMFNINPQGTVTHNGVSVPTILCHQDSYQLKLGSNHGDVLHWFPKFGKSMANARADVAALMNGSSAAVPSPSTPNTTPKVPYTAKVTASDGLNCRTSASTAGSIVKTYPYNTVITITKVENNWGYTGEGWVSLAYTAFVANITNQSKEDEVDMTKNEVVDLVKSTVNSAVPNYVTINDVPSFYKPTIQKLMTKGWLQGTGNGQLNVSQDMCRVLTLLDRAGVWDK